MRLYPHNELGSAQSSTRCGPRRGPEPARRRPSVGRPGSAPGSSTTGRHRSIVCAPCPTPTTPPAAPSPKVLIRRVWLGDPPREAFDRQAEVYRGYSSAAAQQHWRDNGFLCRADPAELVTDPRR